MMRIILPSLLAIIVFFVSPSRGLAEYPNGPFHKVAFVITTPHPPEPLPEIPNAVAEGNAIAKKLNDAGYLVIQYPDPNTKYNETPSEFDEKLKLVESFSASSDQLGDVTLVYYLGHGKSNGNEETLFIPGHHHGNDDGQVSLNRIKNILTEHHSARVLLLLIDACRKEPKDSSSAVTKNSNETEVTTNSNLILEEEATTNSTSAYMNLAHLIGTGEFDVGSCVGIFPLSKIIQFEYIRPNEDETNKAKTELSPYISPYSMDFSPFGVAFLLSIKDPNRSLWDINKDIGKTMDCFTSHGATGFPVEYSTPELPTNLLQYYYFGTQRPDIDLRP